MIYTTERVEAAKVRMREYAAYRKLADILEARPMWSTAELIQAIRDAKVLPSPSRQLVMSWCVGTLPGGERALPGAVSYGGNVGWRIPVEDLYVFFGERMIEQIVREKTEHSPD